MLGATTTHFADRGAIRRSTGQSAGFSLIELLVVVAIILVISAFAIPTLTTTMDGIRLRGTTGSATNIAQRCRMQAAKRNLYQRLHFATVGTRGGTNTAMGQVYLLTSFAMTRSGSKSMAQMETGARPPFTFNPGGAITLPGPEPAADFVSPNSNNLTVNGNDAAGTIAGEPAGCSAAPLTNKPAIGVWDSQSQTNVIGDLGKPQNYTEVVARHQCKWCKLPWAAQILLLPTWTDSSRVCKRMSPARF